MPAMECLACIKPTQTAAALHYVLSSPHALRVPPRTSPTHDPAHPSACTHKPCCAWCWHTRGCRCPQWPAIKIIATLRKPRGIHASARTSIAVHNAIVTSCTTRALSYICRAMAHLDCAPNAHANPVYVAATSQSFGSGSATNLALSTRLIMFYVKLASFALQCALCCFVCSFKACDACSPPEGHIHGVIIRVLLQGSASKSGCPAMLFRICLRSSCKRIRLTAHTTNTRHCAQDAFPNTLRTANTSPALP